MFSYIVPHIFVAYAFLIAVTGWHVFAVIILMCLVFALHYYKLPKSSILTSDEVLQPHKVSIIAHRGAGHDCPENTLAAVREVCVIFVEMKVVVP